MAKLTAQDRRILAALNEVGGSGPAYPRWVGDAAQLATSSVKETAARHLIKLTKLGLAEKCGRAMVPAWRITDAGRQALQEQGDTHNG